MNRKYLKLAALAAASVALMSIAVEANAQQDIFDRLAAIGTKMGVAKVFFIWAAFFVGLGALIWMLFDMIALTNQSREAKWSHIGIKAMAGSIGMAIGLFSGIVTQTLFGTTSTQSTLQPNTSMAAPFTPIDRA